MAIENETADQVVRMVLQGSEVVLKLSGEAALRVVSMIYNALKGDLTTKGKATLWEFMKSGKPQKLFRIPDEYLKAFTTASRKFGFPFVVLKDKSSKDGMTDIMVYASDAAKVDRVIKNFQLKVKPAETVIPEVRMETGELIQPLGKQFSVPLNLIDGIPDPAEQDKRLLAELQKYAAKMKAKGPQVVEPVGLLCKSDGRYQILPGQGSKRIMALRLAGYKAAVADISIPKKEGVTVRAENIDERPAPERNYSPKKDDPTPPEDPAPTKEEGQIVNPTMARTSRDPASGQDSDKRSTKGEKLMPLEDPEKKPSVREKLKECKKISDEKQAAKELARTVQNVLPSKKSDPR